MLIISDKNFKFKFVGKSIFIINAKCQVSKALFFSKSA